jgi:flagellin-like hook-associated protein FlgL
MFCLYSSRKDPQQDDDMSVINTNIKAEMAISALRMNERPLAVAMQQMSTGKRINSARDDAAGLAIANWMTTEVRSLTQAIRNSTDAISLLQTADGASSEITEMLQRMRELSVLSANDTYSAAQRQYMNMEYQQLKKQMVQIADNTEWNGFPILNGSNGLPIGFVAKTTGFGQLYDLDLPSPMPTIRNQRTTSYRRWPTGNTVPLPGQRPSMRAKNNRACGPLFSPTPFQVFRATAFWLPPRAPW